MHPGDPALSPGSRPPGTFLPAHWSRATQRCQPHWRPASRTSTAPAVAAAAAAATYPASSPTRKTMPGSNHQLLPRGRPCQCAGALPGFLQPRILPGRRTTSRSGGGAGAGRVCAPRRCCTRCAGAGVSRPMTASATACTT